MRFRNSTPGGGGQVAHWPYCATPKGNYWDAYFAGGTVWITSHGERPTRPCLHEISGGQLVCHSCNPSARRDLLGYVPVYRAIDNRPVFVIVHADQWERVRSLRLHDAVRIGREENDGDRVWIRKLDSAARYQSTLPSRNVAADITESLLRVWRIPELTEWCRSRAPGGDVPAEAATPVVVPVASDDAVSPPAREVHGAAVRPGELPAGDGKLDPIDFPGLAKRMRKKPADANGDGKH